MHDILMMTLHKSEIYRGPFMHIAIPIIQIIY